MTVVMVALIVIVLALVVTASAVVVGGEQASDSPLERGELASEASRERLQLLFAFSPVKGPVGAAFSCIVTRTVCTSFNGLYFGRSDVGKFEIFRTISKPSTTCPMTVNCSIHPGSGRSAMTNWEPLAGGASPAGFKRTDPATIGIAANSAG